MKHSAASRGETFGAAEVPPRLKICLFRLNNRRRTLHDHLPSKKFIYLHGRKTAGSNIGISLMRHLCPGDIARGYITGGLDEGIQPPDWEASAAYQRPQDVLWKLPRVHAYRRFLRKTYQISSTHMTVRQVRDYLGESCWSDYFTFTFERNPFDRIVSFYHWRTRGRWGAPSFGKFVDALCDHNETFLRIHNLAGFSNLPFYMMDNTIAVDFIGRYENLSGDIDTVYKKIGLEYDGWLPRNKSGIRPPSATYEHYATEDMTEKLLKEFQTEISLFGYHPPGQSRGQG